MSAVSLADAKEFLNITSSKNDDELRRMIDRAEAILAKRVGPLAPTHVTDEVHTGPGPIVLKKFPVVSATGATTSGITVADLVLDEDSGVVTGTFGCVPRAVLVSYVAGRESLPADLEEAVLELVKHLWESQRGNTPTAPANPYPGEDVQPATSGYLLPYRVQSLIEPYTIPTVA